MDLPYIAESDPPALPIKQRRGHYSEGSSVSSAVDLELDGSVCSPLATQPYQANTCTDVFLTAADCHAPQCPIHQRYDASRAHQERFFSDSITPPPVPKKRMTRTMSLPGFYLSPLSTPALKPLSQLNFDTPDEQLRHFFSSFYNQGDLSQGIQRRHLMFLRSVAHCLEDGVLLTGESSDELGTFQPEDFLLFENRPPIQIAGSLYYSLHTQKYPRMILAAKINCEPAPSAHPHSVPPQVNIQQIIRSFPSCPVLDKQPEAETTIPSIASQSARKITESPYGGSCEVDKSLAEIKTSSGPTVLSLLDKGYTVTVERDLPQASLEDFVVEGQFMQNTEPLVYERQLSVLLLQLALGLQHLYSNAATCIELRAQNILLVWPVRDRRKEAKQSEERHFCYHENEEKKEEIQELWRKWGTPRVVLTYDPSPTDASLSPTTHSQFAALLLHCLQPTDHASSQHTQSSDYSTQSSPYLPGLLKLASWLQDPNCSLQISDVVGVLQALLWGPRAELFRVNPNRLSILNNWLSLKQALLLLKLAERGLSQELPGLDWENFLCLQYLSLSDAETVMKTTTRLGLHNATTDWSVNLFAH
ncbi:hypothetical protein UPYG_G00035190 [Umbra pygmaea]|uniref:Pseudopodium-enriched atypical kinase 1 n=1 Tax=Umbra pygmaea TaxID=75934 RepID=A0ABD0XR27_UMBPY